MTEQDCKEHREMIHALEKAQIKMQGDISHIKERLDNGLSTTVTNLDKKFDNLNNKIDGYIMPVCKRSEDVIDRVLGVVFWTAGIGVGGGFLAVVFFVVKAMITKHISGVS